MYVAKKLIDKAMKGKTQAVPGSVEMFLAGNPPTTTHHDKAIGVINGHATLRNSAALEEANAWYATMMPANLRQGVTLAGPLQIHVTFCWHDPRLAEKDHNGLPVRVWFDRKPDWDNSAKGLCDCLVKKGWILDDKRIVKGAVQKIASGLPSDAGVYVNLCPAAPLPVLPFKNLQRPTIIPMDPIG